MLETMSKRSITFEVYQLDNGLEVILLPRSGVPVLTHMVYYKIGSSSDYPQKTGIAHFLEHLMFKGTVTYSKGEFSTFVASVGGEENAFTSYDYTAYYQKVPSRYLKEVMSYEADRMHNLKLEDSLVLPEREVVVEERHLRVNNDPGAQLYELMCSAFYGKHPYAHPILGYMQDIQTLCREDALSFYRDYYRPDNAVLVISGVFDPVTCMDLVKRIYGEVPRPDYPLKVRKHRVPVLSGDRTIRFPDPKVEQPILYKFYGVPSIVSDGIKRGYIYEVLNEMLFGGQDSLLYKHLVLDRNKALHIHGWYSGQTQDQAMIVLSAVPHPTVTLEELNAEIQLYLVQHVWDNIVEEHLIRVKRRLLADFVYIEDSFSSLANLVGGYRALGVPVQNISSMNTMIANLSLADIKNALTLVCDKSNTITGFLEKPFSIKGS